MPQVTYPTDTDIKTRCVDIGLFSGVGSATQTALTTGKGVAVSTEWERKVGWFPFLSTGIAETRYFDPPGGRNRYWQGGGNLMGGDRAMFVRAGILTLTSLYTNVTSTYAGDLRTVDTEFILEPYNSTPKTRIRFFWNITGTPKSIKITAVWGFSLTVPDDVWEGLLMYGVFMVAKQLSLKFLQQAAEWAEGDVRERMDAGIISTFSDPKSSPGMADFRNLVKRYMYPEI